MGRHSFACSGSAVKLRVPTPPPQGQQTRREQGVKQVFRCQAFNFMHNQLSQVRFSTYCVHTASKLETEDFLVSYQQRPFGYLRDLAFAQSNRLNCRV